MATDPLLVISETFFSLQGESTFSGLPCFFIRLAGCNLRCTFCDARYTYEEAGHETGVLKLLTRAAQYPLACVEITGGEPLLQDSVYPLMEGLLAAGRTTLLETNGSINLARVPEGVIKIMDLKCPGSGMHQEMDLNNLTLLTPKDQIKFVVSDRTDYDWAVATINDHGLTGRCHLLFSANTEKLAAEELAAWILSDQLEVRLQLQLHKILWPTTDRGV